jgi:hypothetical protein
MVIYQDAIIVIATKKVHIHQLPQFIFMIGKMKKQCGSQYLFETF